MPNKDLARIIWTEIRKDSSLKDWDDLPTHSSIGNWSKQDGLRAAEAVEAYYHRLDEHTQTTSADFAQPPEITCPSRLRLLQLYDEAKALCIAKGQDYGTGADSFGNLHAVEGFLGVSNFTGTLVRLTDKWTRLCNLFRKGYAVVKSESILDTLKDMANYALIAVVLYEEEQARGNQP